ncbi:MAG: DUF3568 family protein [Nitrospiraceae bacterium]|nr:DUF3568 family protein [Nitrospiraceae bacterium]
MLKYIIGISLILVFLIAGCSSVKYESAGTPSEMPEYSLGYLKANFHKPVSDVYKATRDAYKDLGIAITEARADSLTGLVSGKLANGDTATTDMQALTEKKTAISIRVGTTGDKDFSYILYDKIKKNL